jgi:hypothetical protein
VARNRTKIYMNVSLFVTAFFTFIIWKKQDQKNFKCIDISGDAPVSNLILVMSLSAYILTALYSMVYSKRRLSRPGVSGQVR